MMPMERCPKCGGLGTHVAVVEDRLKVITCPCGWQDPNVAMAAGRTPPGMEKELRDYADKATADLRAELSRVHHEKETALDRLARTEQNVAALKAELEAVKKMWKRTIEGNQHLTAELDKARAALDAVRRGTLRGEP